MTMYRIKENSQKGNQRTILGAGLGTLLAMLPACSTVTQTVRGAVQGATQMYDCLSQSPQEAATERAISDVAYGGLRKKRIQRINDTFYNPDGTLAGFKQTEENTISMDDRIAAHKKYLSLTEGNETLPVDDLKPKTIDYVQSIFVSCNPISLALQAIAVPVVGVTMGAVGGALEGARADIQNHLMRGKNGVYHPGNVLFPENNPDFWTGSTESVTEPVKQCPVTKALDTILGEEVSRPPFPGLESSVDPVALYK